MPHAARVENPCHEEDPIDNPEFANTIHKRIMGVLTTDISASPTLRLFSRISRVFVWAYRQWVIVMLSAVVGSLWIASYVSPFGFGVRSLGTGCVFEGGWMAVGFEKGVPNGFFAVQPRLIPPERRPKNAEVWVRIPGVCVSIAMKPARDYDVLYGPHKLVAVHCAVPVSILLILLSVVAIKRRGNSTRGLPIEVKAI
jgi:hypothetical protein